MYTLQELISLIVISGLLLVAFIITIAIGLIKQSKNVVIISVAVFFCFIGMSGFTIYKMAARSVHAITNYLKPRSGPDIYKALFDSPTSSCLQVIDYRDQVIPKIDDAIWLHFKTCPVELKRIVSMHDFDVQRMPSKSMAMNDKGRNNWFTPEQLGDTIIIYTYKKNEYGASQIIYSNRDQTEAYCIDALE